jgi:hypothetical protein
MLWNPRMEEVKIRNRLLLWKSATRRGDEKKSMRGNPLLINNV